MLYLKLLTSFTATALVVGSCFLSSPIQDVPVPSGQSYNPPTYSEFQTDVFQDQLTPTSSGQQSFDRFIAPRANFQWQGHDNQQQTEQRKLNGNIKKATQSLKLAESDEQRRKAENDLREALNADYDFKMDRYDDHLEQLENQLQKMRDRVSKRRAAQRDMVELKLRVLKAEAEDLGWPTSPPRNQIFNNQPFLNSHQYNELPRPVFNAPQNPFDPFETTRPSRSPAPPTTQNAEQQRN